jgi:hypothetical protein
MGVVAVYCTSEVVRCDPTPLWMNAWISAFQRIHDSWLRNFSVNRYEIEKWP